MRKTGVPHGASHFHQNRDLALKNFKTSIFVVMRPKNEGKNRWNDHLGQPPQRKEKGDEERDKNCTRNGKMTNTTSR
ncbi:MAG TPA: hypothetical protein VLA60_17350 [Nitrospirales bacterium]|nr:hypothetical protein [Nitrospirales bacterium]